MERTLVKPGDHEAMGIRKILVVQPKGEVVWQFKGGALFRTRPESPEGSRCTVDRETIIRSPA